jgi:glycosyltransferase involved in cell wall biosynthesis
MFLSAIEKLDIDDWRVVIIGPVEKHFEANIDMFYQKNPRLKEKVIFTGAIYDRKTLFEWYARSKIFCFTSIEESFGFVLIEAMTYADYVVTTSISSANEITNLQQAGMIVKDEEALTHNLNTLMQDTEQLQKVGEIAVKRAKESYSWMTILQSLHNLITKI